MTFLIIIVVALIALVLYLYLHRRRERTTGYTPYIEALVALLEDNEELAMKKLKEAVNIDSRLSLWCNPECVFAHYDQPGIL